VCAACRQRFGLPMERWDSRRPPRPCVRCGHDDLVRALVRERGADNWRSQRLGPLGVTFHKQTVVSASGHARELDEPDLHAPAGLFEVTVCRACGYAEWYVVEPEEVPIGPEYATERVGGAKTGPWR
jgi:hypothetical protein